MAIALQFAGHLRGICEPASFRVLEQAVSQCRAVATSCDLYLHTWQTLHPQTPSWHTQRAVAPTSSEQCIAHIAATLRLTSLVVESQPLGFLGNTSWDMQNLGGRIVRTGIAMEGVRSAIHGAHTVARLREAHETTFGVRYAAAVRLRPDLAETNGSRVGRAPPGSEGGKGLSVEALQFMLSGEAANDTVYGCSGSYVPGRRSGDMCFWAAPPAALDHLLQAYGRAADEHIEFKLCWQRKREQEARQLRPRSSGSRSSAPRVRCRGAEDDSRLPESILFTAARDARVRLRPLKAVGPGCRPRRDAFASC